MSLRAAPCACAMLFVLPPAVLRCMLFQCALLLLQTLYFAVPCAVASVLCCAVANTVSSAVPCHVVLLC